MAKINVFDKEYNTETMRYFEKGLLKKRIEQRLEKADEAKIEALKTLDANKMHSIEEAESKLKKILKLLV